MKGTTMAEFELQKERTIVTTYKPVKARPKPPTNSLLTSNLGSYTRNAYDQPLINSLQNWC
jgi:hypothetical protein